jgi:hypothetical protein
LNNAFAEVSKPIYFFAKENTFPAFSTAIFHPPTA